MKKQLLKPWLIIALAFLLVSTVVIRIAEYQLPAAAHRLHAEVENRYDTLAKQDPVPEAENALPVYEEAKQLMLETQQKYPERQGYYCEWKIEPDPASYHLWDYTAYVLPLPSQPLPEEVKEKIRQCVEIYRTVLDKLHYAATLKVPDVFWEGTATRNRLDMEKPLLMEALLCILDNNEAGAMKALATYRALTDVVASRGYGGYGIWHGSRLSNLFWDIYYYGMERNVFTPASLATLQAMFVPEQAIDTDDIVRDCYIRQRWTAFYINKYGARPTVLEETFRNQLYTQIAPVLANSLLWYEKRLYVHGALATLPGMQALQRHAFGDASDEVSQFLKRRGRNRDFAYLTLADPFDRYGYLNFDHMSLYEYFMLNDEYASYRPSLYRTIIALGRYYREKGAFPENIEVLKDYVSETDLNIFHHNMYAYKHTDTGWIIYHGSASRYGYRPVIGYPLGTVKESGSSYF